MINNLEIILAIELLEYHDKKLLNGNDESRSKFKQSILKNLINEIKIDEK